jgi:S1-C subfamily serine protease
MTHRAVLISNWPKSSPTDILNTFADQGDSGSWVLNNGGDLVGIVTSGFHSTDTVAYMMPLGFEIARLDMVNQFNKIAGTSFELDWPSSDI